MFIASVFFILFFFNDTATTEIYTLSLHDALPISEPVLHREVVVQRQVPLGVDVRRDPELFGILRHGRVLAEIERAEPYRMRSEEHTSELQSPCNLVCRLLLEKKKITI